MKSFGQEKLSRSIAVIEQGIRDRLHLGAQLYVSHHQQPLASLAVGEIHPNQPLTTDHLMHWMSCSKMITAVALAKLWEQQKLDFNWPVRQIIPEFGCNGKEEITFAHILTHTGGFRVLNVKWDELSWDESIAAICAMPLEPDWQIGKSAGYHISTSWMILGEALRRIDGRPIENFVREELFVPLAMPDCYMGIPTNSDSNKETAPFYQTSFKEPRLVPSTDLTTRNAIQPGSSGRGPIYQLGRFMQMLANEGELDGTRLLQARTVKTIIHPYRKHKMDKTFGSKIDWALGFMIDSKHYGEPYPYNFGPHASPSTFGHNGNQSSAAFVDPENELVICWAFNGLPGEAKHQQRLTAINQAIYEDLDMIRE